jgi:hypothetical protein
MAATSGYKHYAGLKGSKQVVVGQDPDIYNYTDIQSAIDGASNDDVILIAPGTYTLTALLDWDKPLTLMGMGGANDVIITSALTTHTCLLNMPATGSAAAQTFKARNIKFANSSTGDAIEIDNDGGLAQNMIVEFQDCSFVSTSGVAVDLDQTTETKDMFITISGNVADHFIGASNLALEKAGSVCTISGMECGVFTLGTVDTAWIFNMINCAYISQAQTTGGSASALCNYLGNSYYTAAGLASTALAGVATDFDATAGTEYWASNSAA